MMRSRRFFPLQVPAVLLLLVSVFFAAPARADELPRQLVHLLDYVGRDYPAAVEDGKVISEFEYKEQQDFLATIDELAATVPELRGDDPFKTDLAALAAEFEARGDSETILALSERLKNRVIEVTDIAVAPSQWPDMALADKVYGQSCAGCHGVTGAGDGPDAVGFEPPATDFLKGETRDVLSPFQAYNTIRNGVQGTGMPAFADLSDEEAWSLAFYVLSLQHRDRTDEAVFGGIDDTSALPTLTELATTNDRELRPRVEEAYGEGTFLALRLDPARFVEKVSDLDLARNLLNEAMAAYRGGNAAEARRLALSAYLDGIEPFEVRMVARDSKIVPRIEMAMMDVRSGIVGGAPVAQVEAAVDRAQGVIVDAEALLQSGGLSYGVALASAALILLREGFEAILVVAALLGILRRLKAERARHWTHAGWIAALVAGFATWILSGTLLNIGGAEREWLEGVTGLTAVAILLYVGFWMHNQAEIRKWTAMVSTKARQAVADKRFYTFFGISFLAVYREAFETVLFYQALALDAEESAMSGIYAGFGIGVIGIALMGWAMLKLGKRMPLRQFFQVASVLVLVLSVVLLGKGIHSLQEAGFVGVSSFPLNLRIELLGVYPTWETMLGQLGLILVIVAAHLGLWYREKRIVESRAAARAASSAK